MPRYRKLHTKALESLDINDMPNDFTRLFWVLLPLVLCREGRGLNSPTWLKSKLFPLREDVSQEQVKQALDWCVDRGMIVPYTVDGRDYFSVPSFPKYQGNTAKEAESDYPAPVGTYSGPTPDLLQSRSGTDADADTDTTTDADTTTTTDGADKLAPTAVAAVVVDVAEVLQALESFGMGQPETVFAETGLSPPEIVETLAYAEEQKLGAGWVRKQLRENHAHRPRTPADYWRSFVEERMARGAT